jgi:DNA-binding NarL/FixJ family response regulator
MGKIRVLFVEDDPDFVFLIRGLLESEPDFEVLGYADNRNDAVLLAQSLNPDIVLMDLNLSGTELDGIEAARQIRLSTDAKVILLTAFEQPDISVEASKKSFASGYIFKSQYEFIPETIRKTARGHTSQEDFIKALILSELSTAEKSVFQMILGKNVEISSSDKTIANQKTQIFKKLGIKHTHELRHIFKDMG